jgi:hypothetical protein
LPCHLCGGVEKVRGSEKTTFTTKIQKTGIPCRWKIQIVCEERARRAAEIAVQLQNYRTTARTPGATVVCRREDGHHHFNLVAMRQSPFSQLSFVIAGHTSTAIISDLQRQDEFSGPTAT